MSTSRNEGAAGAARSPDEQAERIRRADAIEDPCTHYGFSGPRVRLCLDCHDAAIRAAEARGLERARAVIEFYSGGWRTDGSLARAWLAQHPQVDAPKAPTDSLLQVPSTTQETNQQRAATRVTSNPEER